MMELSRPLPALTHLNIVDCLCTSYELRGIVQSIYSNIIAVHRGGWMICDCFDYLSPFCFLLIEFHGIFSIFYKILLCLLVLHFD